MPLEDLRAMAANTPMEYGDLTGMSRSLATGFKDDPARMLSLMVAGQASSYLTGGGTARENARASSYLTGSYAIGLPRVPRDNFPALLHEGERVLTAREARQQDKGGSGGVVVQVTGPVTVREEADIERVADAIWRKMERARLLAVP